MTGRVTPFTLWLSIARVGEQFVRIGIHDGKMGLAARRAGRRVTTERGIAVTGMKSQPITIATIVE